MNKNTNNSGEMNAIRRAVWELVHLLAAGAFEAVVAACSTSRLNADDVQGVIDDYGCRLVSPPEGAYTDLDVVRVTAATVPTWSVWAPIYTVEEGISDLTLQMTVVLSEGKVNIELNDIRVP